VGNRFQLTQCLGQGVTGAAWLALDRERSKLAVVKLLHDSNSTSPKAIERFRREVKALTPLRTHPHVVCLIAHGTDRGRPYYAMEWAPGVPLSTVLRTAKTLGLKRAVGLAVQLLHALHAAHGLAIVHRDLKPDNLMIERPHTLTEHLRVIDFGLAKHLLGGPLTAADLTNNAMVGTPLYTSPEQCRGMTTGPPTDVYAAGCVLMQLLTGAAPFTGKSVVHLIRQHCKNPAPRLETRLPQAPRELADLLHACLAKEPSERPTAAALGERLVRLHSTLPDEPVPTPSGPGAITVDASTLDGATADGIAPLRPPSPALPESGPAQRLVLEFSSGQRAFLFAGTRLRLGRSRDADLMIRSFPVGDEGRPAADARSELLSNAHAKLLVTVDGVAIEDSSSQGTSLNGVPLERGRIYSLPGQFKLTFADVLEFSGAVYSAPPHPGRPTSLAALRLERPREAPGLTYLLVAGGALLGGGDADSLRIEGLPPSCALIQPFQGQLGIRATHPQVAIEVAGQGRLSAHELTPLREGMQLRLGGQVTLRVRALASEDMKAR
jgi:serine/threonine protein kinase